MKKVISVFLAAVMCLSSVVFVNAEQQTDIVGEDGTYDVVFADECDDGQKGVLGANGTLEENSDGTITFSGANYQYNLDVATGSDWTAHLRFKYMGDFTMYAVADNVTARITLNVNKNGIGINQYTDSSKTAEYKSLAGIPHTEGAWYEYLVKVSGSQVYYYRKVGDNKAFDLVAVIDAPYYPGNYAGWLNQKAWYNFIPGGSDNSNTIVLDYLRIYSEKMSESDLISSDKQLIWSDDFTAEGGTRTFSENTILEAKPPISTILGYTCKFGLTWNDQSSVYVCAGRDRVLIQPQSDRIWFDSIDGIAYVGRAKHEAGKYYEYIIDVGADETARYYRKAAGEDKYTLIATSPIKKNAYADTGIQILASSSQYDYFNVYSKVDKVTSIFNEEFYDEDLDDNQPFVSTSETVGDSGYNKYSNSFSYAGDYYIHTRLKATQEGGKQIRMRVNAATAVVDLKVADNHLAYSNASAAYTADSKVTHTVDTWYDYCIAVSESKGKVTYYRKTDNSKGYERVLDIDKNTNTGAAGTISIDGIGSVEFVKIYKDMPLSEADLLGGYNVTALYEKNIHVPVATTETVTDGETATTKKTEGEFTAARASLTYPYALHLKLKKNDGDMRIYYGDEGGKRIKFELYNGGNAYAESYLAGKGLQSGDSGEFILVADGTNVKYYKKVDGGYEWFHTAEMKGAGSLSGLTLKNGSTTSTADFDFIKIYSLTTKDILNIKNLNATADGSAVTGSADVHYGAFDENKSASFTMIVVVYDENGALKAVKPVTKTVNGGFENGGLSNVSETLEGVTIEDGDTYKVFAWDSLNNMMPY